MTVEADEPRKRRKYTTAERLAILSEWRKHPGLGPSQIRNQLRRRGVKVSVISARRVMEDAPKVQREPHDERFEAVRPNHLWHLDFVHRNINRATTFTLIFSGKHTAGTLPDGVDARYLIGIVRNVHHRHEAEPITEALIRERLAARDRFLVPLVAERDAILAANGNDVGAALVALVDRLVHAKRTLDRHVWLDAAADLVAPLPPDVRVDLAKRAARRIHTTFALAPRDRAHLERALLRRLWPLT